MGFLRCIVNHSFNRPPLLIHHTRSTDIYRTMPSKRFLNHLTVSFWLILWLTPMGVLQRRRLATRSPGRVLEKNCQSVPSSIRIAGEHLHAAVEVHAVDTDAGVVLDTQIDVLGDTEAEVAGLGEVALPQLILLDLQATLQNLLGLGATDGDVNGDLLVTTDTEGTDGVAGLAYSHTHIDQKKKSHMVQSEGHSYCRQESDRSAAQAPWRHGSVCHQTRRPRCSAPISGCAARAWGLRSCPFRPTAFC